MTTANVKGLKELDAFLAALPKKLETGAYRAGLTAAARVIADEAKVRVPRKTGKLAKAIGSSSPRKNQDGTFSISVRVRGPNEKGGNSHAFLGLFHEYGVRPHLIASTGKGEGRVAVKKAKDGTGTIDAKVLKIGDRYVSGVVSHPGHAARPFMRPALDAKWLEAVEAFRVRIVGYLENKTNLSVGELFDEAA